MFTKLKNRLVRHKAALVYTVSNVALAAATLVGSFACARLLLPEELGAFQTALLLVTYLGFLPLGVFNGFNRDYPFLLGKGDHDAANRLARVGYSVARVTATLAAVIALGQVFVFSKAAGDPVLVLAGIAVIPIAALSQVTSLQTAILTGQQSFGWISRTQFLLAFMTLALLALVWKFVVHGQAIRLVIIAAVPWMIYLSATREARKWLWDWRTLVSLIKRGIPILATGYLYQVFSVADRTLVAAVKGTEAVGHYALAGLAVAAIQSVYMPLAVATYSKANAAYGQSPTRASLIFPLKRFLLLVTFTVVPMAALIYFCLPILVPWLLPNYVEGVRAGQIACIASVGFSYCGTSFVFNVTCDNRIYAAFMACALGIFFLIGFQIPGETLSLEGVAWLRASITVGLCLLSNVYLAFYMRRKERL